MAPRHIGADDSVGTRTPQRPAAITSKDKERAIVRKESGFRRHTDSGRENAAGSMPAAIESGQGGHDFAGEVAGPGADMNSSYDRFAAPKEKTSGHLLYPPSTSSDIV